MRHTIGEFGPGPLAGPGPGGTDGAQQHGHDGHPAHRSVLHGTRAYYYDGTEPSAGRDYSTQLLLAGSFSIIFAIGAAVFSLLAAFIGPGANPGRTVFVIYAVICVLALAVTLFDLVRLHRDRAEARPRIR